MVEDAMKMYSTNSVHREILFQTLLLLLSCTPYGTLRLWVSTLYSVLIQRTPRLVLSFVKGDIALSTCRPVAQK